MRMMTWNWSFRLTDSLNHEMLALVAEHSSGAESICSSPHNGSNSIMLIMFLQFFILLVSSPTYAHDEYAALVKKGSISQANAMIMDRPVGYERILADSLRDKDERVRVNSLRIINQLHESRFLPDVKLLSTDPAPKVRETVLAVIANNLENSGAESLRPFLQDPDPFIRSTAAAYYLKAYDDEKTFNQLLHDKSNLVRLNAIMARVSKSEDFRFRPQALDALQDKDPKVRRVAVQILGIVGTEDDIAPLQSLYSDKREDLGVRGYAANAVKSLKNRGLSSSNQLVELGDSLHSPNPGKRQWAARELANRPEGRAILMKAANAPDSIGAQEARAALKLLGN